MSYTLSGSGHGVDREKAQDAFRDFVKALDEATDLDKRVEGWADPSLFQGSSAGGDEDGGYSLTADQVRNEG